MLGRKRFHSCESFTIRYLSIDGCIVNRIVRPGFFMENFDGFIGKITASVLLCGLKPTTQIQLVVCSLFPLQTSTYFIPGNRRHRPRRSLHIPGFSHFLHPHLPTLTNHFRTQTHTSTQHSPSSLTSSPLPN